MQVDENLKQFATDRQWASYVAYCETGSGEAAARKLGIDSGSIRRNVKAVQEKALRAGLAPHGFKVARVSTQYDEVGVPTGSSVVVKAAADSTDTVRLPDPKKIVKTSTLYAGDGSVTQQWVLEKPQDVERERLWELFAQGLADSLERIAPTPTPEGFSNADLLAVYPVGDHHVGMLAWDKETGGDSYDLRIAEDILRSSSRRLIGTCPPCDQALIAFLGDFTHYDSYDSVTPQNKHLLDAEGRYPKMVDAAVRMIRNMISAALERHKTVRVIFEKGNHDPATAAFMTVMLAALYENEPRVSVDTSPQFFHYYEFGRCLLGTNHGDKVKPAHLLAVMANDMAEAWGRTRHRLMMTGHVHHESRKEYPGGFVESFGVLPPADAYAAHSGYRSTRQMNALVFHREHGHVERHTVNPGMFKAAS
jgi:hypothetical protein